MKTREKIVAVAVKEFNRHGSRNVTTNRLAQAAGISPGNLYYHFRNKEEIVRVIFAQIAAAFDALWQEGNSGDDVFDLFDEILTRCFSVQYQYRFFFYEISSLLHNDPLLRKQYVATQETRMESMRAFCHQLADKGFLREYRDPSVYGSARELVDFIANCWMVQADLSGRKFDRSEMRRNMVHLLEPLVRHFTPKGLGEYERLRDRWSE